MQSYTLCLIPPGHHFARTLDHARIQRGLGIHKALWFLSNTGPDPLKRHNTSKLVFNVGHYRPASGMPFNHAIIGPVARRHLNGKMRFVSGPIMVQFSGIGIVDALSPSFKR